jgi:uncharacterized protein YhfF
VSSGLSQRDEAIHAFWTVASRRARLSRLPGYFGPTALESLPPPAWSFGVTREQADEFVAMVLAGTRSATSSSIWDYQATGAPLPQVGTLGIVLDGADTPRVLIATTAVAMVPFGEVPAEHAYLEGEGDRTLADWRERHRRTLAEHAQHGRGFDATMLVVLERFTVLYRS